MLMKTTTLLKMKWRKSSLSSMALLRKALSKHKDKRSATWKFFASASEVSGDLLSLCSEADDLFGEDGTHPAKPLVDEIFRNSSKDDYFICLLCLKSVADGGPETTSNIFSGLTKSEKGWNVGNLTTHLSDHHPGWKSNTAKLVEDKKQAAGMMRFAKTTGIVGTGTESIKNAKMALHDLIVTLINDTNLADRACENEILRMSIVFCIRNAKALSHLSDQELNLGRRGLIIKRKEQFMMQMLIVEEHVKKLKNHYDSVLGKEVPFIWVTLDHWDGHDDFLGISIHFTTFKNWKSREQPFVVHFAAGLIKVSSHKARVTKHYVIKCLEPRFGIKLSMLLGCGVDTTSSAILTGALVGGEDNVGECDMHVASLLLRHTSGKLVRTRNKQAVDAFPAFRTVFDKFLALAKLISKHNIFDAHAMQNGRGNVRKIPLPGDTRVAGELIMIQAMLRENFMLDNSFCNNAKFHASIALKPNMKEWEEIAEAEGVLRKMKDWAMDSQGNSQFGRGHGVLRRFDIEQHYTEQEETVIEVVDLNKQEKWMGSTAFKDLPTINVLHF